jgi:ribosomal protein L11 methyltransferase
MDKQPPSQSWIVFNVIIDEEYADLISTRLIDILPEGLITERIYGDLFPHELSQANVPVSISAYIPENESLESIKAEIRTVLRETASHYPIPEPTFSSLENQDWAIAWQKHYQPIPLGNDLVIVPSWMENPYPERLEIRMDPGMAFGSGTHPTTQLSLILLEQYLAEKPVHTMIDIGFGSGILAIAGVKLGIDSVLGVDNDQDALKVARANAILNKINNSIDFQIGSVAEILKGQFDIRSAPLVTANIIAPILTQLFEAGFDDIVDRGGSIILSGILKEQLQDLLNLIIAKDLVIRENIKDGDWIALRVDKP